MVEGGTDEENLLIDVSCHHISEGVVEGPL